MTETCLCCCDSVDFAILNCSWPRPSLEHIRTDLLPAIRPEDWQVGPEGMVEYLDIDEACEEIASFTLDTRFGKRKFKVWRDVPWGKLVVVKEPAPRISPATVHCVLTANPPGILAAFTLLSGANLGTETLQVPLMVGHLRTAATRLAWHRGLLETSSQQVSLALQGFEYDPPNALCLCWPWSEVSDAALQSFLTRLQSMLPFRDQDFFSEDEGEATSSSMGS